MGSGVISVKIFSLTDIAFLTKLKHKTVLAFINISLNTIQKTSIAFIFYLNGLLLRLKYTLHSVINFVSALLFTQFLRSFRKKTLLAQVIATTLLTAKAHSYDGPLLAALAILLAVYGKSMGVEGNFDYFHVMRNIMKFFLCQNILI